MIWKQIQGLKRDKSELHVCVRRHGECRNLCSTQAGQVIHFEHSILHHHHHSQFLQQLARELPKGLIFSWVAHLEFDIVMGLPKSQFLFGLPLEVILIAMAGGIKT